MIHDLAADLEPDPHLLGGKAAGLVRLLGLGLPVPPAFVLDTTTDPAPGRRTSVAPALQRLSTRVRDHPDLGPGPVLVSVRSGAPRSMPGMLDTVLNVGPLGTAAGEAAVEDAVQRVLGSWSSLRARTFRAVHGIPDRPGTAVLVQVMVAGDRDDDSLSGVAFSRDPLDGSAGPVVEYLPRATGEDLMSGRRAPHRLTGGRSDAPWWAELAAATCRIEADLRDLCEVEFTVESGRLWFLQARVAPPVPTALPATVVGLVRDGVLDPAAALDRLPAGADPASAPPRLVPGSTREVRGLGAGPGVVTGRIATSAAAAVRMAADGPVVLVRPETSPGDLSGIVAATGLVTARGGTSSHAAVVARSLGKVAVVGVPGLRVDDRRIGWGRVELAEGDLLSVDGSTGLVVAGRVDPVPGTSDPAWVTLHRWAAELGRTLPARPPDPPTA